jgi:TPR repeat protein
MTTFLLLIIVLLLLAILCRIDPGIKRLTWRVLRTSKIAFFCAAALISGISLWLALGQRLATFYQALEAGQFWTWTITLGLFVVSNALFDKLTDYTRKHGKTTANTFVIIAWFLCFCTFAGVCGSVIIGWLKERSKTDPDLGWKLCGVIGGFVLCRVLLDRTFKEIGRYRACHSKERTLASFILQCCCRQRCRTNCAACSVCNTYHHTTLDHPGPPTEELEVHARELSDAEAEAVAEWARSHLLELLKGIDLPEGQDAAATRGRMIAERHGGEAARGLGLCYSSADPGEAIHWWRIGVERADLLSAVYLGQAYNHGSGVPKDPRRALRWYRYAGERAIEDNDSATMHALGDQYEFWYGRDYRQEAFKWYSLAAERGNTRSMVRLAEAYRDGEGTEKNLTKATEWCKRAAEYGDNYGNALLNALLARTYEEPLGSVVKHIGPLREPAGFEAFIETVSACFAYTMGGAFLDFVGLSILSSSGLLPQKSRIIVVVAASIVGVGPVVALSTRPWRKRIPVQSALRLKTSWRKSWWTVIGFAAMLALVLAADGIWKH